MRAPGGGWLPGIVVATRCAPGSHGDDEATRGENRRRDLDDEHRRRRMGWAGERHSRDARLAPPRRHVVPELFAHQPCRWREQQAQPQPGETDGRRFVLARGGYGHRQYHLGDRYRQVRMTSQTPSTKCQYSEEFLTATGGSPRRRPRASAMSVHPRISNPRQTCDPWKP